MPDARSPRVWLAVAWSVFQLYTAYAGMYDLLIQLPVHVAFAVALGFLTAPIADSPEAAARLARRRPRRWLDGALAALALLCAAHYVWHNERLASRMAMVDAPPPIDAAVGVLFVALLLGAAWRHIGPALVAMALAFIAYVFVGPRLPGFLSHGGESAVNLIDQQMLTTQGVFGIPTLVSATFIFLFVVFGSVTAASCASSPTPRWPSPVTPRGAPVRWRSFRVASSEPSTAAPSPTPSPPARSRFR